MAKLRLAERVERAGDIARRLQGAGQPQAGGVGVRRAPRDPENAPVERRCPLRRTGVQMRRGHAQQQVAVAGGIGAGQRIKDRLGVRGCAPAGQAVDQRAARERAHEDGAVDHLPPGVFRFLGAAGAREQRGPQDGVLQRRRLSAGGPRRAVERVECSGWPAGAHLRNGLRVAGRRQPNCVVRIRCLARRRDGGRGQEQRGCGNAVE